MRQLFHKTQTFELAGISGEFSSCKIRLATIADAKAIYQLMWDVYEQLPNKDTFYPDSYEWVYEHIEKRGFILVAETSEIIAYFLVRYPMLDEDNLGRDIALSDEELLKVAMMDSCVVAPECRGAHLQQHLFSLAEECIDKTNYCYLMGTAAPDNKASCRSFEKSGYICMKEKEKYGGKMRRVYLKIMYPDRMID